MKDLSGTSIWIIGASSGIGRALAKELAARGASLVLSARTVAALQTVRDECGGNALLLPLDVCDAAAIEKTWQELCAQRVIDRVLYMAGTYTPAAIVDCDVVTAQNIFQTNVMGAIAVVHQVLPVFLKRGHGQIGLCASVAGYRGLPNAQPYGASKAALIHFAETLRAETQGTGIDVKVINPGFVRTPMTDKNTFAMPMMIEPEQAARSIANDLERDVFEIHFPKTFTFLLKLLSLLPDWLYFGLVSTSPKRRRF